MSSIKEISDSIRPAHYYREQAKIRREQEQKKSFERMQAIVNLINKSFDDGYGTDNSVYIRIEGIGATLDEVKQVRVLLEAKGYTIVTMNTSHITMHAIDM